MSRLMRASAITKRPVVTMAGEDVGQIKDIVYSAGGGDVGGFTLAGRGLLAGPMNKGLAWSAVKGLGADAVMIADEDALDPVDQVLHASTDSAGGGAARPDVLGSQVLTDDGTDLGEVVDVIVAVTDDGRCDVVGYEIEASEALGQQGTKMLLPLPDTLSASGEHLMVPSSARDFVRQDLAGFGAAVDDFRTQLGGQR